MREIVVDTETTGGSHRGGDRIVEIGCVELVNSIPTGEVLHRYVNPRRDVPPWVVRVHGLNAEFLADKPGFEEIAEEFLEFVGDAGLVAHNAPFDLRFINMELARAGQALIPKRRMVDTLQLARGRFPGRSNTLDALCERFGVGNGRRDLHGALLDARLLAKIYPQLSG